MGISKARENLKAKITTIGLQENQKGKESRQWTRVDTVLTNPMIFTHPCAGVKQTAKASPRASMIGMTTTRMAMATKENRKVAVASVGTILDEGEAHSNECL